ncbi:MAG TPA: hypothetical protein VKV25_09550 [Acidimicrobiales bacterium]|nr:hypothetical protein [Acidimicrobiales bacterium]
MRSRVISPRFFTSGLLSALGVWPRLTFLATWCYADDHGYFEDDVRSFRLRMLPDEYDQPVGAWMDVLVAAERLVPYLCHSTGVRVLHIPTFATYQRVSHPTPSKLVPDPSDLVRLPTPTIEQRAIAGRRYRVGEQPSEVVCEHCGEIAGNLRYWPTHRPHDDWRGAVVAERVEIVPLDDADEGVAVLCRRCRAKFLPAWEPAGGIFGDGADPDADEQATAAVVPMTPRRAAGRHERATPENIQAVFDAWRHHTGHERALLDDRRRKAIVKALASYEVEDLVDACEGVTYHPWNSGRTTPNGRRYDSIELVLRDAEHIERFRDLARDVRAGRYRPGADRTVGTFGPAGRGEMR